MDKRGEIFWANHKNIQHLETWTVGPEYEVYDGERLPLMAKRKECTFYPESLKHTPDGRLLTVYGGGEFIIYIGKNWRTWQFGSALEVVFSNDRQFAVRKSPSEIKIFDRLFQEERSTCPEFSVERIYGGTLLGMYSNGYIFFFDWDECRFIRRINVNLKNLYWSDSGDTVAITCDKTFLILKFNHDVVSAHLESGRSTDERGVIKAFEILHEFEEHVKTGFWFDRYFIYTNSDWKLNYYVAGEVTTMFDLGRKMYLIGYIANNDRVYLIDKEFNIIVYSLLLGLNKYKTLVIDGDLRRANEVFPLIPTKHHNSLARFLESRGMMEHALQVATDPDYRFELAIRLGRIEIAKEIAAVTQSESKWKQLGELAKSIGRLEIAEDALKQANDLNGLLLLYCATGNTHGVTELASVAKESGKIEEAVSCLFMLGKLEECCQLLVDSNWVAEAAFMARSYFPSKVPDMVALWRKDLNKKAAESLADPEEYPNLFEDWQTALRVEREKDPPAAEYENDIDKVTASLVDMYKKNANG